MNKKENADFFEIPNETLHYRKCLGYFNYVLIFLLLICLALFAASIAGFFQVRTHDQKMAMSLIVNAGFFGMFSALFFSLWRFNFNPILKAKIKLFDSSLLFSTSQREYSIYYEDLDKVEFVSFLGFARLVLKTKDHDIFSYSMWVAKAEKILDSIHAHNPKVVSGDGYEKIRKDMILSGHNFERLEYFLTGKTLLLTLLHVLIIPGIFLAIMVWKQSGIQLFSKLDYYISSLQPFLFVVTIATGLYFIVTNILITRYMMQNNAKKIDTDFRDHEGEKIYLKKAYPYYASALAILLTLIVTLDVNFYSVMMVSKGSAKLNLLEGDKVWVDKRFNCVSCKYQLKKDDVIVFVDKKSKKRTFGKVVNLHPEYSRVPASIEKKFRAFQVLSSVSEVDEYITFDQVVGKKL